MTTLDHTQKIRSLWYIHGINNIRLLSIMVQTINRWFYIYIVRYYEKPDGIWTLSYLILYLHMRNEEINNGYANDTGNFESIRKHAHDYGLRVGAYPR